MELVDFQADPVTEYAGSPGVEPLMKRFGLLIIALFGLAGCNNDSRYVCISDGPLSDRGCFLCRGDECHPQPAPQRALCVAAADCAVGEVCTILGCVGECTQEYECPLGTTCADNGLCLNPLDEEPDPPPFRCQFNFECDDERICIDGECLLTCVDAPCPDTRPEQFCPETDCQPGRVCVRGQCRTPCETDDECARIDATIRFCELVEEQNLCVRSIEVLAECQLNIDCGFGEECVDGACAVGSESS